MTRSRRLLSLFCRSVGWVIIIVLCLTALLLAALLWRLEASRPRLSGTLAAPGLRRPAKILRDRDGVPTIVAANRRDLAFALGFVHAQERFFQMDELRRAAAGELGELFGPAARPLDEAARIHLFRARARIALTRMTPWEQDLLQAYTDGVNRGLGNLGAAPFEYALLRQTPVRWRPEDSLLVVYAMYLDLEEGAPTLELDRARAEARGGKVLADLLYPEGGILDAALDGSRLPSPVVPHTLPRAMPGPLAATSGEPQRMLNGSNDWAVAGQLTTTGAAMVSNDMHLRIAMPNIWYRAHLLVRSRPDALPEEALIGVTLPGVPILVAGSNGAVAWGYTDAYADTHDAVVIDPVSGQPGWYQTPAGPRQIMPIRTPICAREHCTLFTVRETVWGPIVAKLPDGHAIADRWIAHDPHAIEIASIIALEHARTVQEAVATAHRAALPDENMIAGDRAGHIAWTIIGHLPARFGFDGRDATSWADGSRGWRGTLAPDQVPTIIDPPDSRLWSANNRVVGGAALARIGDGGGDDGARARRIAQRLLARTRFSEPDMLAIQLDPTALRMRLWQHVLLQVLARHGREPRFARMVASVRGWSGGATADSVGYRLIRGFRGAAINKLYGAWLGAPDAAEPRSTYAPARADEPLRLLLTTRPAGLLPPGFSTWNVFEDRALGAVADQVAADAHGDLSQFSWGAYLHADIHHPLANAIPLLGLLTDPADQPMPGDAGVIRAQYRGGGASERFTISPGHETSGLFEMPGGQAGDPLAPYYLAGHRDWVEGRRAPLMPGPVRWRLTLVP